jgi:hypothetical protein
MHEADKMRFEQEMRTYTPLTMQEMEAYKEAKTSVPVLANCVAAYTPFFTTIEQKKTPYKPKGVRRARQFFVSDNTPFSTTIVEQKKFYKLRSCLRISKENKGLRFGLVAKICDKEWEALDATDK